MIVEFYDNNTLEENVEVAQDTQEILANASTVSEPVDALQEALKVVESITELKRTKEAITPAVAQLAMLLQSEIDAVQEYTGILSDRKVRLSQEVVDRLKEIRSDELDHLTILADILNSDVLKTYGVPEEIKEEKGTEEVAVIGTESTPVNVSINESITEETLVDEEEEDTTVTEEDTSTEETTRELLTDDLSVIGGSDSVDTPSADLEYIINNPIEDDILLQEDTVLDEGASFDDPLCVDILCEELDIEDDPIGVDKYAPVMDDVFGTLGKALAKEEDIQEEEAKEEGSLEEDFDSHKRKNGTEEETGGTVNGLVQGINQTGSIKLQTIKDVLDGKVSITPNEAEEEEDLLDENGFNLELVGEGNPVPKGTVLEIPGEEEDTQEFIERVEDIDPEMVGFVENLADKVLRKWEETVGDFYKDDTDVSELFTGIDFLNDMEAVLIDYLRRTYDIPELSEEEGATEEEIEASQKALEDKLNELHGWKRYAAKYMDDYIKEWDRQYKEEQNKPSDFYQEAKSLNLI